MSNNNVEQFAVSHVIIDATSLRACGIRMANDFNIADPVRFNNKEINMQIDGSCHTHQLLDKYKPIKKVIMTANLSNDMYRNYSDSWLNLGYEPVHIDYRHVCNPGKGVSETSSIGEDIFSLSSVMSYMLGGIAYDSVTWDPEPKFKQVTIVTHSFDVHVPVIDLLEKGFHVNLVFFTPYIDRRWFLLQHERFTILNLGPWDIVTSIYPMTTNEYPLLTVSNLD